jgi:2-haloacid dehalogenase
MSSRRYDAILFDLLTGLLDSWSLWNSVAGSETNGRRWRGAYLRITYETGRYRPYERLVGEAAEAVGLPRALAGELARRYDELQPWPDARPVLVALQRAGLRLGVVTNCSEVLGRIAVGRLTVSFDAVVTAERAGFYKPHPRPYQFALQEAVSPRNAVCSLQVPPMTLMGRRQLACPPFGMTGSV